MGPIRQQVSIQLPQGTQTAREGISPGNPRTLWGLGAVVDKLGMTQGAPERKQKRIDYVQLIRHEGTPDPNSDTFQRTSPPTPPPVHTVWKELGDRFNSVPLLGLACLAGWSQGQENLSHSSWCFRDRTAPCPSPPNEDLPLILPTWSPGERTGLSPKQPESSRMLPAVGQALGAHSCLVVCGSGRGTSWSPRVDRAASCTCSAHLPIGPAEQVGFPPDEDGKQIQSALGPHGTGPHPRSVLCGFEQIASPL